MASDPVADVDAVLRFSPPQLTAEDASRVALALFGVPAARARDLGSERDRTFRLEDGNGDPIAVLKVSNSGEDPAILDMEAAAALHVSAVDPGLHVAVPRRALQAHEAGPARPD